MMINILLFSGKRRKYDIAFSGALQNKRGNKVQSDVRLRILNRLYYTLFDIPLVKRKKYSHLSIYWNSTPTTFFLVMFYLKFLENINF